MDINEKLVDNLTLLLELMEDVYLNSVSAYDCLKNYEGDYKYVLALNYLGMAHNGYLKILVFITENSLEHTEILPFTSDFKDFKIQFDIVISEKYDNTSWIYLNKEQLFDTHKYVREFISSLIEENIK